jgi:hypothetical protein
MLRRGVRESPLDWNGVFREDSSSERVSTALLFAGLIKHCLQNHALCAPSRFLDLIQHAKRLKLQLLLALREGDIILFLSSNLFPYITPRLV